MILDGSVVVNRTMRSRSGGTNMFPSPSIGIIETIVLASLVLVAGLALLATAALIADVARRR
jgi:hypothetical protein